MYSFFPHLCYLPCLSHPLWLDQGGDGLKMTRTTIERRDGPGLVGTGLNDLNLKAFMLMVVLLKMTAREHVVTFFFDTYIYRANFCAGVRGCGQFSNFVWKFALRSSEFPHDTFKFISLESSVGNFFNIWS
jgi:hypothetical protein